MPKARTIEHLGRAQIADMPTAILELWKNGYDAYADNVSCDLYAPGSLDGIDHYLLTLTDDGIGMSQEDVIEKWLTVGTESKTSGVEKLTREERLGKDERIKMGEKGIGRLSVGYLGSPMLMVTKKKDERPVLLFVDWRVFTNYNLYLSDIEIPVEQGYDFHQLFAKLHSELLVNLPNGEWGEHGELLNTIENSVKKAQLTEEIYKMLYKHFGYPEDHGTMFVIFEFDSEQIGIDQDTKFEDLKADESSLNASWLLELRQSLSGMINPFITDKPAIEAQFNIHRDPDTQYNLVSTNNFFDHTDIDECEHSILGTFDENGFFEGTVKVFGKTFPYSFRPTRIPGLTPYGPFDIKLGHIEGQFTDSSLSEDHYRIIEHKMDKYGGLYIYKDHFRILPYGRTDYDFLGFEERRTKRAGTYYFSHRKMAGCIELTRQKNSAFREKAGREGFIQNRAFKEFRRDLIEFFVDVAEKFYASSRDKNISDEEKTYRQLMVEAKKAEEERIKKLEDKKDRKTQKALIEQIEDVTPKLSKLDERLNTFESRLERLYDEMQLTLDDFEGIEEEFDALKKTFNDIKIMGYGRLKLNDRNRKKFDSYKEKALAFDYRFDKYNKEINDIRSRLELKDLAYLYEKNARDYRREFGVAQAKIRKDFIKALERVKDHFSEKEKIAKDELEQRLALHSDFGQNASELKDELTALRKTYDEAYERLDNVFKPFIEHLYNLDVEINEDQLTGFYKVQYEQMKERAEQMYELAQLGIAIEIIDHQFNVLYHNISRELNNLKELGRNEPKILENLETLRMSIEHLETNHQLLAPLYRTTRRAKAEFTGKEVIDYISRFFGRRLEINGKSILQANDDFLRHKFYTFPSVIKPVFINLINNSLYWLKSSAENNRHIQIDKRDNQIVVCDSGKGIEDDELKKVFQLFFSRRPGGRGIGLYLAKTNLNTIGMNIFATNDKEYKKSQGACFVIRLQEEAHA